MSPISKNISTLWRYLTLSPNNLVSYALFSKLRRYSRTLLFECWVVHWNLWPSHFNFLTSKVWSILRCIKYSRILLCIPQTTIWLFPRYFNNVPCSASFVDMIDVYINNCGARLWELGFSIFCSIIIHICF